MVVGWGLGTGVDEGDTLPDDLLQLKIRFVVECRQDDKSVCIPSDMSEI